MKFQKPQRSIRVSDDEWNQFKVLCDSHGMTISEQIGWFIRRCIEDGELPQTDELSALKKTDKRADILLDHLEARLNHIADQLEARLTQALPSPEPSPKKRKPKNS
jgi:antitoxin component of RelBE/YafQ-DinJ toxin-antitoxin module